jgi:glutamine synthetase type III
VFQNRTAFNARGILKIEETLIRFLAKQINGGVLYISSCYKSYKSYKSRVPRV